MVAVGIAIRITGFGHCLSLAPAAPPSKPESLLPEDKGGLPLIPDAMPTAEKEAKEKKTKASAAEDALRDQIKLRIAKTKAKEDPELQAIWDSHYKARNDYEMRQILTKYYTLLCERIVKIDKTIKPEVVDNLKVGYMNDYNQNRIEPTEPPKGLQQPAPKATPTPKPKR